MKKILALALAAAMSLSLVACGGGNNDKNQSGVAHQHQTVRGKLARITPRQWEHLTRALNLA